MPDKVTLSLANIKKSYKQGAQKLNILNGASLEITEGEVVALAGPSGCGKTTLLQVAGLLDSPDSGKVSINGRDCAKMDDKGRTLVRRHEMGFIYQFHHLLPEFTALENIIIPQMIAGVKKKQAKENAMEMLRFLGLEKRAGHKPFQLSGGEQQRVAIARAVVNRPSLLLADEPTGNLDPKTADNVFRLLLETAKAAKLSMLLVTHNMELAARADRAITLRDGMVYAM